MISKKDLTRTKTGQVALPLVLFTSFLFQICCAMDDPSSSRKLSFEESKTLLGMRLPNLLEAYKKKLRKLSQEIAILRTKSSELEARVNVETADASFLVKETTTDVGYQTFDIFDRELLARVSACAEELFESCDCISNEFASLKNLSSSVDGCGLLVSSGENPFLTERLAAFCRFFEIMQLHFQVGLQDNQESFQRWISGHNVPFYQGFVESSRSIDEIIERRVRKMSENLEKYFKKLAIIQKDLSAAGIDWCSYGRNLETMQGKDPELLQLCRKLREMKVLIEKVLSQAKIYSLTGDNAALRGLAEENEALRQRLQDMMHNQKDSNSATLSNISLLGVDCNDVTESSCSLDFSSITNLDNFKADGLEESDFGSARDTAGVQKVSSLYNLSEGEYKVWFLRWIFNEFETCSDAFACKIKGLWEKLHKLMNIEAWLPSDDERSRAFLKARLERFHDFLVELRRDFDLRPCVSHSLRGAFGRKGRKYGDSEKVKIHNLLCDIRQDVCVIADILNLIRKEEAGSFSDDLLSFECFAQKGVTKFLRYMRRKAQAGSMSCREAGIEWHRDIHKAS